MYILEYSEQQGQFHFNNGSMWPETFGWETVCRNLSYDQCLEFAELMRQKYSLIGGKTQSENPSFELIKQEFVNFLLT